MSAPSGWSSAATLTITEAARVLTDLLGRPVSRSLAYEWAHAGRIPARKDRLGRFRVTPAALRAFVAAETVGRPQPWEQPPLDLPGLGEP